MTIAHHLDQNQTIKSNNWGPSFPPYSPAHPLDRSIMKILPYLLLLLVVQFSTLRQSSLDLPQEAQQKKYLVKVGEPLLEESEFWECAQAEQKPTEKKGAELLKMVGLHAQKAKGEGGYQPQQIKTKEEEDPCDEDLPGCRPLHIEQKANQ